MGNKRIVPFLHRVLVKPDKIEDVDPTYRAVRAAGLMVAESTRKQEQNAVSVGTVLAVGPTCFLDYHGQPADLKIGDRVIFARYGGKARDHQGSRPRESPDAGKLLGIDGRGNTRE